MADTIEIPIGGGSLRALAASPGSGTRPGVIVLHELFGLTEFIEDRVDWFAEKGFVTIAPELYWRTAPGIVYDYAGADFDRAFATRGQLDDDQAVADIGVCAEHLRANPDCAGPIAVVGYCLGGLLAYLAATRLDISAAVSFHGVRIETRIGETRLEEPGRQAAPLLLHFCGLDKYVPQQAVKQIKTALSGRAGVEFHDYPDADHGFSREGHPAYDAAASSLAHQRTLDFLGRAFGPSG